MWVSGLAIMSCLLLLLSSCKSRSLTSASSENSYREEVFTFFTKDVKQALTGTLTLPLGFKPSQKALILVTPPGASSQTYEGLYTALAKVLVNNGIAVLTFDPRHLADTSISVQTVTVFDQAEDAESAYAAMNRTIGLAP